ncbi:MAG: MFS transporter [Candidatus Dormibacteraeota bacterium]|uniref:MFS transporter n=1 Tax=Candidatus Dormiibacter inghamiae TaxID=3127013 RepID=A0A934K8I9_9BACT|nr:MFS transporter [Candidatus Dormibacteraeota bacterium]MBJ7606979.1 MFS transporter [Candidatus Dormibacteraeota bacterium]
MPANNLTRGQKVFATAGVMLALLLASLDQTVVGTAMPRIISELNGLEYYAWVTTAYLVSSTIVVPIAGKLGDMFGRKPFLLTGMVGFVLASALCGLSQNMFQLTAFRAIQGLFGGMLFATVFTVLADIFPPEQRVKLQGVFGGVFGLSSVIGPTLGGWLTDGLGWRWVFYVNLPVGILAVTVVALGLPYVRSHANWRQIDFLGGAVLAAGLVPLLIALSITNTHAWTSPEVLGLLILAGVLLISFFFVERRASEPIVPFQLFKLNAFTITVIIAFFTAFGMFGSIIFVPLIYQGVLGVSATNSGQLLTPMVLGLIVFSIVSGQLMIRIRRYRVLAIAGASAIVGGLLLLSQVTVGTSQWEVVRDLVIIGAGLGTTFPLTINVVQSALAGKMVGVATSQVQFWRNLGGTVGTAVLGSVLANRLFDSVQKQVAALHLPPQIKLPTSQGGSSPQALFDPNNLAHLRATLPPQAAPLFDQFIHATRLGLADTLHSLFLIAAAVVAIAIVASFFLREVPLKAAAGRNSGFSEAPVAEEAEEEFERKEALPA